MLIHHFNNRYCISLLLVLILFFIFFNYSRSDAYDSYIDFSKGEPLPHEEEASPNVTIEDWRFFSNYIGKRLSYVLVFLYQIAARFFAKRI